MDVSQDLVALNTAQGPVFVGLGRALTPSLHKYALHNRGEIYARLALVARDVEPMSKLRRVVARATSKSFLREQDLLRYVADAASSTTHEMIVLDLSEQRFSYRPVSVGGMSLADRFMEVLKRVPKYLPSEVGEEFKVLLSPEALAMLAGTLAIWAGAHFCGVGEAIDVVLIAVGFAMLGWQIFGIAKLLVKVVAGTIDAKTDEDLDAVAKNLADVMAKIGVATFIALLTKGLGKHIQKHKAPQAKAPAPQAPAKKAQPSSPPPSTKPADAPKPAPKPTTKQRTHLDEMYEKAPRAKEEIDAKAQAVADEFGGKVAKAPIKSEKRVLEKANSDYGGDVTRVKDYARNTVVVDEGNKSAALSSLKEQYPGLSEKNITIVDAAKDPCGYSGIKVNVPTKSGMTAETQINSPEMIFAKEKPADARAILGDDVYESLASKPGMPEGGLGHQYYEQYRVLDPKTSEAAQIADQSRAYYDAVRGAAQGGS